MDAIETMGAPVGNTNAAKAKVWADAIRYVLAEAEREETPRLRLRELARILVSRAADGDLSALKELGDRLDGKPAQAVAVTGEDGGAVEMSLRVTGIPPA